MNLPSGDTVTNIFAFTLKLCNQNVQCRLLAVLLIKNRVLSAPPAVYMVHFCKGSQQDFIKQAAPMHLVSVQEALGTGRDALFLMLLLFSSRSLELGEHKSEKRSAPNYFRRVCSPVTPQSEHKPFGGTYSGIYYRKHTQQRAPYLICLSLWALQCSNVKTVAVEWNCLN